MRVNIDDGNTASNTATATSNAFEMDKALPTTPTNSSPTNASYTTDTTPTLQGSAYSDNTTQTAGQFQVSTTSGNYASPLVDQTVSTGDMTQFTASAQTDNTYYWHFRYKDSKGNWSSYSTETSYILDTVAPSASTTIRLVDASNVTDSTYQQLLSWTADTDTNFKDYLVVRSTNGTSYQTVSTITTKTTNYYFDQNLSSSTTYYYKVTVEDQVNSPATSSVVSNKPGSADTTAPTISSVSTGTPGTNSTIITWTTNENSNSLVDWGTNISYGSTVGLSTDSTTSHSVTINKLSPGITYYIRVRSSDSSGNTGTADNSGSGYSFITTSAPTITSVATTATATTISVAWTTATSSNSLVDWGTNTGYGNSAGNVIDATTSHIVTLNNLSANTTYYLRVRSRDANGNEVVDDNSASGYSKTTSQSTSSSDTTAPSISGLGPTVAVEDISATITWTTNESSNSIVRYGETSTYGKENGLDDSVLAHNVNLVGLSPNTAYHYTVRSKDSAGNFVTSDDHTFTTKDKSVIQNVAISNITLDSAIVTWETTTATTSDLNYGKTTTLGTKENDQSLGSTTKHTIKLNYLSTGTTYYFQTTGTDEFSKTVSSDTYNFTTLTLPSVSGSKLVEVQATQADISWKTNVPTSSTINFGVNSVNEHSQGAPNLTADHFITLVGLEPKTDYKYSITGTDSFGHTAQTQAGSFTTKSDTYPPVITNFINEASTLGVGDLSRIQMVVSWTTDEPATSQVLYGVGLTGDSLPEQTTLNKAYDTSHIVIVKNLDPSTTYRFVGLSNDKSDNTTNSQQYTVLTPPKQVSVLQVIVSTLEDTFSFIPKLFNQSK